MMTKEQYLHSECASCYSYNHCGWRNRGETCNTIRYASRAWDKAVETVVEHMEENLCPTVDIFDYDIKAGRTVDKNEYIEQLKRDLK